MINEIFFNGTTVIVPLADIQHIEKHFYIKWNKELDINEPTDEIAGYVIITKHTRWDMEADTWANNIYLNKEEGEKLINSWHKYRNEIDSNGIAIV